MLSSTSVAEYIPTPCFQPHTSRPLAPLLFRRPSRPATRRFKTNQSAHSADFHFYSTVPPCSH